jgi:hypothetical protein
VKLPWDRVRAIGFVAPPAEPKGVRTWMADGSVIDAAEADWMNADFLRVRGVAGTTEPVTLPRNFVTAVRAAPGAALALAAQPATVAAAADAAGMRYALVAPRAADGEWPLDAAPLAVEGPVLVRYAAPRGPSRLLVNIGRPPRVRGTGACELVLRAGGAELARQRLDASHVRAEWSMALPASPFELELLAADGDPAGDSVVLERAMLVPSVPPANPAP